MAVRRTCLAEEAGCIWQSPDNSKITRVDEANWIRNLHYYTCLHNPDVVAALKKEDDKAKERRKEKQREEDTQEGAQEDAQEDQHLKRMTVEHENRDRKWRQADMRTTIAKI